MTEDNIHAIQVIGVLSIFAAALFVWVSYSNGGYAFTVYRCTNLISIIVSTMVLFMVHHFESQIKLSFHKFHAYMFFYISWLTYCGMVASVTDSMNGGGFIAFLTTQVWIYDLLLIPPFVSAIFCGGAFLVFSVLISHMMYFPAPKYLEVTIFYLTIIAVNYYHYRSALVKISREELMMDDNHRLDRLSTTDELTEVRNRTGLRMDLDNMKTDHLFVLMCDIDDFKKYNDRYGHETGDRVLSEYALALSGQFGSNNVYRYGGDEFLVLARMEQEADFLEKVRTAGRAFTNLPVEAADNPTSSCGYVYGHCHHSEKLRSMIRAADIQLYEAKKKGKNQIQGVPFEK